MLLSVFFAVVGVFNGLRVFLVGFIVLLFRLFGDVWSLLALLSRKGLLGIRFFFGGFLRSKSKDRLLF